MEGTAGRRFPPARRGPHRTRALTEFHAFHDREQFTFGPLRAGDVDRCTNMVHYDLRDGLFARIRVGRYRAWSADKRLERRSDR
ncbi:hypothetical protein [Amycolatopsis pithecellobii]|uniref:Uncharacterized protein n=1 Tax=Amycolatopsis pithecellobii TaxID=664692 RepID=A0A6N7YZJ5_9PSEU|nr:hypothetical protein [Amycolatopsis pithecellobii]MTD53859.1 hypothetical protein [Amycolatopsis pithecellobii]